MRKSDREVLDPIVVEALLQRAEYVHLALRDGEETYSVPVSFGYRDRALYFHGAAEGRKARALRACDRVSFSAVVECELARQIKACAYSAHYKSVCGSGRATILTDPEEKAAALDVIMGHYEGPTGPYPPEMLKRTEVVRLDVEVLSGKANPPWQGGVELDDDECLGCEDADDALGAD
ncbi:hypothetical protein NNJEOMEG_01283 [Fundidesulfovibrio magnetotacticus]|uniref:Flavin-nucleotide-binding protein n=1 Tax=Fundidesulfovibrio magnetotacticus TaxID=2730080 RepID=A0A6V8LR42_9BACT|nr:pyridoxamine 5'-phosphate oxidase family protein [Fundidesulfovibrio magnetotacticus]GFK93450.1 hypothetical protein NNJEOMEG_01283 [Fundidesulfovibrio magnetotacticus]